MDCKKRMEREQRSCCEWLKCTFQKHVGSLKGTCFKSKGLLSLEDTDLAKDGSEHPDLLAALSVLGGSHEDTPHLILPSLSFPQMESSLFRMTMTPWRTDSPWAPANCLCLPCQKWSLYQCPGTPALLRCSKLQISWMDQVMTWKRHGMGLQDVTVPWQDLGCPF